MIIHGYSWLPNCKFGRTRIVNLIVFVFEDVAQHAADGRLVVDDEYSWHLSEFLRKGIKRETNLTQIENKYLFQICDRFAS